MVNIALRTINENDFHYNGLNIKLNVTLKGNSKLWIFTRCFVNKDVNESGVFDIQSEFNDHEDIFNKYTAFIVISKEKLTTKSFVEFGSFYEQSSPYYKALHRNTFLKRQLIDDSNPEKHLDLLENDSCDYEINITDMGSEEIIVKVTLNQCQTVNEIRSNVFVPLNKRAKIMFAGNGESIIIHNLNINIVTKNLEFSATKESCSCCIIS